MGLLGGSRRPYRPSGRGNSGSSSRGSRWPYVVFAIFGLFLAAIVMGVLALPLLGVRGDAAAAKAELSLAADALRQGKSAAANEHVAAAERYVAEARKPAFGASGTIWQWVPVAGSAVRDMRHLVSALDHSTKAAGIAAEVYPQLKDAKSVDSLVSTDQVDIKRISELIDRADEAVGEVRAARRDIEQIEATAPMVGGQIAGFRDEAAEAIYPLADQADRLQPVLQAIPELFGAAEPKNYLVAFMNPAELRWSGGTVLTISSVSVDEGRLSFGETYDLTELGLRDSFNAEWEPVVGNPFHPPGLHRLPKATYHPDWSVSGEELIRAVEAKKLGEYDAALAVDVPALAKLLGPTGAISAPRVGEINQGNLVQLLSGSYDEYDSQAERKAINQAVVPIFRERFLAGGNLSEKLAALGDAAAGRHLAIYARDENLAAALSDLGFGGQLSDTDHDYLGVFSTNANTSKADYWQKRALKSTVKLAEDGTAKVSLAVRVTNTAPPYVPHPPYDVTDAGKGYFTRLLGARVLVVLPKGADEVSLVAPFESDSNGGPVNGKVKGGKLEGGKVKEGLLGERAFFDVPVTLEREESAAMRMKYSVAEAATVAGDRMTYRLDYDPQGMVNAQDVTVNLVVPEGWSVVSLPSGWVETKQGVRYQKPADDAAHSWQIVFTRAG